MNDTTTFAFSIVQLEALTPQIKTGAVILLFILFDIITGLIKSLASHSYESSVMRQGLFHKLGEIVCFIFGVVCDIFLPYLGVSLPVSIAKSICVYIVIMEIGSVIENIGAINPDLAKYLHKIFAKFEEPKDAEIAPVEESENEDDNIPNS